MHIDSPSYDLQNSILIKTCQSVMKHTHVVYLLVMFLMTCQVLYSTEQDMSPRIDSVFLTCKEVEAHPDPNIRFYAEADAGHSKTFLSIKNFPINKKMSYAMKRPLQKDKYYKRVGEFIINEQAIITSANDPEEICHYFSVSARGFLPGERVFFRFKAKDGSFEMETHFIPNPIKAQDKSGIASIEAELVVLNPAFYQFKFNGFKENEVIKSLSISGKEEIKNSFKISKDVLITDSPNIMGEQGGVGKIIFTRDSGEKIRINLPWGLEWLDYLEGTKIYKLN